MNGADVPGAYRARWPSHAVPSLEAALAQTESWAADAKATLPVNVDPRSVEEIVFEKHLRQLVLAFTGATVDVMPDRDQGEITVCALTNLLGSVMMAGITEEWQIADRIGKIADRLRMFGLDEMERNRKR